MGLNNRRGCWQYEVYCLRIDLNEVNFLFVIDLNFEKTNLSEIFSDAEKKYSI